MADGGTRVRRIVLHKGIIMIYGDGFWHPHLAGHVGEVVEAVALERCMDRVLVQVGQHQLFARPIPDLIAAEVR